MVSKEKEQKSTNRLSIAGDWMDAIDKALSKKPAPPRATKKRATKKARKKRA